MWDGREVSGREVCGREVYRREVCGRRCVGGRCVGRGYVGGRCMRGGVWEEVCEREVCVNAQPVPHKYIDDHTHVDIMYMPLYIYRYYSKMASLTPPNLKQVLQNLVWLP